MRNLYVTLITSDVDNIFIHTIQLGIFTDSESMESYSKKYRYLYLLGSTGTKTCNTELEQMSFKDMCFVRAAILLWLKILKQSTRRMEAFEGAYTLSCQPTFKWNLLKFKFIFLRYYENMTLRKSHWKKSEERWKLKEQRIWWVTLKMLSGIIRD